MDDFLYDFDDGFRVYVGDDDAVWAILYPPQGMPNMIGDKLDEVIHWLRCRGLVRRLVRTGRCVDGVWTYSEPEGDPSPA